MSENFEFKGKTNPKIVSLVDETVLRYYITKREMSDFDTYCKFVNSVKSLVRKDARYTNYKAELYNIGLGQCQIHSGITSEMAPIEMHHGPLLSLFDVCSIVTDHLLNEDENINTFIVADKVLNEHEKHNIQIVMLCETCHEAAENGSLFVSFEQGFGQLDKFLKKYKKGIHRDHLDLMKEYTKLSKENKSTSNGIFEIIKRVKKYIKD